MNIRQNLNIGQHRSSPTQAPLSPKALAEKLKAEGAQEVARGEQLQKDGVDLQSQGSETKQAGEQSVQVGEGSKATGQAKVEEGSAKKVAGEEKIVAGLQTETVARSSESQHATEFQIGLDAANASRESAGKTLEVLQGGLDAEKAAHGAEGGQLANYGAKTVEAGVTRAGSAVLQGLAAAELGKEKEAQASADAATTSFKAGIDTQAEGRKLQGDGRNDVRVADDLKGQSENASNRAKGYLDRAVDHLNEASNLKEEAAAHNEASTEFKGQATVADSLGKVVSGESDAQSAVSALLAAKAAIDLAAAESLGGLSQFSDEAERTKGEGLLAGTQSVRYAERGIFYGSVAEGLADESGQLSGQAALEDQQAGRRTEQASNRETLGFGDAKRAVKFFGDAQDLGARSGEVRARGEGLIAEGGAKHAEGTATLEQALGQLQGATAQQEASHAAQTEIHTGLTDLNGKAGQLITDREGILGELAQSGAAQTAALTDQAKTLGSLLVDHALGGASQQQRSNALDGLRADGSAISGAIATQGEGFTQRTEGAATEQIGAGMIRDGETLIKDGTTKIADGERLTEAGRQKEEAGKIVADKGQKYQEIAEKAAQEIPFHIAK